MMLVTQADARGSAALAAPYGDAEMLVDSSAQEDLRASWSTVAALETYQAHQ